MAPLFIALSFSFGLAVFLLVLMTLFRLSDRPIGPALMRRLARLLAVFIAAVLYFTTVQHLTNIYAAQHTGVERFILLDGGIYTAMFWIGQVLIGGVIPLALIFHPRIGHTRSGIATASVLVILGGFAQLYVIIIGGQAYPLNIFPGYEVSSSFFDGAINSYTPSLPESLLGLGGIALALAATGLGVKILRILPTNLSDANVGMKD
jgi:[DsrC]-trisulfide reductase subunit P